MKKKMKKRIEKVVAEEKIIVFDINVCRKLHFDRIKQLQDIVIMQNNLGGPNVLLKTDHLGTAIQFSGSLMLLVVAY